jgi:hypothetical protein
MSVTSNSVEYENDQEEEVKRPVVDVGNRKFGVVIFDDEKEPREGWSSVNGSPAKRVKGANQLATDTIWWTNLSYDVFFKGSEMWRIPYLRHDAYMVVKQKDVLHEWGLDTTNTPGDYLTSFCSSVFSRIMNIALKISLECNPRIKTATLFSNNTLREDLRWLLPKCDYPRGEASAILRSGQAFSEFTRTTVRGPRGGRLMMLRKPRISYATEMLTTPIPYGSFVYKSRTELKSITNDRVDWVRKMTSPCMVEISVKEMHSDVAHIYGFGNSTDKDKKVSRSWVAHPEFMVMSSFSDIEVKNLYLGKEYTVMTKTLMEPVRKFLGDKYNEYSWSAGIIAETLWRASSLGEPKSTQERNSPDEKSHTSWRGAWIKASDKANMFISAMKMTEFGYSVISYGYGWIMCQVDESQISDFIKDGLTIGMTPKLVDIPNNIYPKNQPISWGGDKRTQMLAQMSITKEKDLLWNMDKLPLYEKEQKEIMLKKIIIAQRQQKI